MISPIYDENDIVVDYYYKNVNNKFISKIGKTREEIIDKRGTDIIGFIEDYWFKSIEKVIKIGNPIIYRNYSDTRKTYFEFYAWKVNEKDVAVLLNDLTAQKENERFLLDSKEEIDKLTISKERLIAVIAHDLRSPFNAIIGFSNLLIDSVTHQQDLEETLDYSKIIHGKAKETLVLLDNLLDYGNLNSKYVHFDPKRIPLSSIIDQTIKSHLPEATLKNISLTCNVEEQLYVYVDKIMLEAIIRNLISNALKFSCLDGTVTVSMKQIGGDCKVTVTDNGVGIPFDKQADLFSFKTNRTTKGTLDEKGSGLGLLICREYLERNNGAISVKSEIGHGSEFSFTLPLVAS
ncbi:MAG: HAMP domain-containing sensor histidine kinase [Polaribacter sp.]|nr:HAMP domain-containing sensor histidine kinase [Polaribacter sp.]